MQKLIAMKCRDNIRMKQKVNIKRSLSPATLTVAFILFAFIFYPKPTTAQISLEQAQAKIEAANNFYNQASYDTAVQLYQQVIDAGYASDRLYYNLGNAFYKLRDIPSAILYYEKASKLNPNDEDIAQNLEIANSQIIDKIEPLPQLFLKNWWRTFYTMFNANAWAWISVVLLASLLVLLFIFLTTRRQFLKKISFFLGLLMLLLTLGAFGLASQKYYYTQQINEAIIFTPTITVKSSPGASSVDLFVLHAGTKVRLLDKTVGWNKIRIANGSVGWLPDESMKGI